MRTPLPRRGSRTVGIWAVLPALLTLSACAEKAEAPVTYLGLDCAQPFEAQAAGSNVPGPSSASRILTNCWGKA